MSVLNLPEKFLVGLLPRKRNKREKFLVKEINVPEKFLVWVLNVPEKFLVGVLPRKRNKCEKFLVWELQYHTLADFFFFFNQLS